MLKRPITGDLQAAARQPPAVQRRAFRLPMTDSEIRPDEAVRRLTGQHIKICDSVITFIYVKGGFISQGGLTLEVLEKNETISSHSNGH